MNDTARLQAKQDFLTRHGWGMAEVRPLAGDASFRKYDRARRGDEVAVLMDAPPPQEDVAPFVAIARWLVEADFPAPRILAEDRAQGFLLLEDLGDDSFTRVLRAAPEREAELYLAAGRLLAALHQTPHPLPIEVPPYDREKLLTEAALLPDWYLRAVTEPAPGARESYFTAWNEVLGRLAPLPAVLVLRDYHADNLMLLPEVRENAAGYGRVGLLDFQDALIGSPAYDLVSYLEDARRDVQPATREAVLQDYAARTGTELASLRTHLAILGAQRNCKILGIFLRLTLRDGKPQYLDYIPRIWALLEVEMAHPELAPVKRWMETHLPASLRTLPALATLQAQLAKNAA